jgi:acyl-CoA synthetase (AMP-forming)/AMP-acid ligase II
MGPRSIVHQVISTHAHIRPKDIALLEDFGDDWLTVTYEEVELYSNEVAAALLTKLGSSLADVAISVFLHRSNALIIAVLGILKSGAAFVPLNVDAPSDMVAAILKQVRPPAVITDNGWKQQLEASLPPPTGAHTQSLRNTAVLYIDDLIAGAPYHAARRPERSSSRTSHADASNSAYHQLNRLQLPEIDPEQLAYILFTSGTTGNPKGVMMHHRGMSNLMHHHLKQRFTPKTKHPDSITGSQAPSLPQTMASPSHTSDSLLCSSAKPTSSDFQRQQQQNHAPLNRPWQDVCLPTYMVCFDAFWEVVFPCLMAGSLLNLTTRWGAAHAGPAPPTVIAGTPSVIATLPEEAFAGVRLAQVAGEQAGSW